MIEINMSDNLHLIGWLFVYIIHIGFVYWFYSAIKEWRKGYLNDVFDKSMYVGMPTVLLILVWLGILSITGWIVWT